MTWRARIVAVGLAAGWLLPCAAQAAPPYAGAQFRYWDFNTDNDLRDYIVYWVPGPFHATLEYWDYRFAEDQFRPELGIHLRDARRSVYTLQWRHERRQERFFIGTDQVLARGFVGRAEVSPIVSNDSTLVVLSAGFDYYWGSYHFFQASVIRDPRDGGLWVVPLRVRLATEGNNWLQAGIAPASERTIGWSVEARISGVRVGIERNNRYDFTSTDNLIFTLGYERLFGPTD